MLSPVLHCKLADLLLSPKLFKGSLFFLSDWGCGCSGRSCWGGEQPGKSPGTFNWCLYWNGERFTCSQMRKEWLFLLCLKYSNKEGPVFVPHHFKAALHFKLNINSRLCSNTFELQFVKWETNVYSSFFFLHQTFSFIFSQLMPFYLFDSCIFNDCEWEKHPDVRTSTPLPPLNSEGVEREREQLRLLFERFPCSSWCFSQRG